MQRCFVLAFLLVATINAFRLAPIRWGGIEHTRFVIGIPQHSFALKPPRSMVLRAQRSTMSDGDVPRFIAKADHTIIWNATGWCLEASGDELRANQCNGGRNQLWNWLPWGPIQLKNSNRCLDVFTEGDLDGVPIKLHECEDKIWETWRFDEAIPMPSSPRTSVSMCRSMASFICIVAIVVLGVTASFLQWYKRVCLVHQNSVPEGMEHDGLCLFELIFTLQNSRTITAVMALNPAGVSQEQDQINPAATHIHSTILAEEREKLRSDRDITLTASSQRIVRATVPRLPSAVPAPEPQPFAQWLEVELAGAPGADVYGDVYTASAAAVSRWQRRYQGDQALWRRLRKKKLVKEIVECAPVIAAVQDYVASATAPVKIVDLCCGKGYLSMLLAELLPPERVRGCVLVDKAWPPHNEPSVDPKHINPEHLWGAYRTEWPVHMMTSKVNLKKSRQRSKLEERWLSPSDVGTADSQTDADVGPVLLLGVHLCGKLSLHAVELFNRNPAVAFLAVKPCCLPPMVHAEREETFTIGSHAFAAADVAACGKFSGPRGEWHGPPRSHLQLRFGRWTRHLHDGIEVGSEGAKRISRAEVQVKGGYQNVYLFAERGARTAALWEGVAQREAGCVGTTAE